MACHCDPNERLWPVLRSRLGSPKGGRSNGLCRLLAFFSRTLLAMVV